MPIKFEKRTTIFPGGRSRPAKFRHIPEFRKALSLIVEGAIPKGQQVRLIFRDEDIAQAESKNAPRGMQTGLRREAARYDRPYLPIVEGNEIVIQALTDEEWEALKAAQAARKAAVRKKRK